MEFSISVWMAEYQEKVEKIFGSRIWFNGLQGSYGRNEASEQSDIDVVLILDQVSAEDLHTYGKVLDSLPAREKICGFVSGKEELLNWDPSELFQFCCDTTPVRGSLDKVREGVCSQDIRRAVHMGVCNIYHMCVHNMLHEKSIDILRGLYKSAVFTLQAIAFLQTGIYAKQKAELLSVLQGRDRDILEKSMAIKAKESISGAEQEELSAVLLAWASKWICRCAADRKKDI